MIRCAILAGALLLPAPAFADTLIDDVNGISVDREGHVSRFAALVIDDHGRIAQVLSRYDKAPRTDYKIDGQGRTLMPGMIDAHLHVMELGLSLLTLDLSGTKSLAEAQAKIAEYAKSHPDAPWIVGRGWNQETWQLGRFPTAAEIDAVVSDRPVWLGRVDGHAAWGNSLALAAGGVTAKTADPLGGRIERVAGSQKPAGVLIDNARTLIDAKVPPPRPQDRDLALHKAQELLERNGVTAVGDMDVTIENWMAYRRAGDSGRLQIRLMSYAASVGDMILIGGTGPTPWLYDDRLRLGGLGEVYSDGALGSRGALLKAPYADDPKNTGNARLSGTQLRNIMSRAAMDHFQVAIHAIGDAANAEVLDAIDELSTDFTGDRRWRVEHAQIVDPVDLPRFAQHGIVASMQPVHQTSDRIMTEARLGPYRLAGAYAWRSMLQNGVPLAFGSDSPVEAPEPFVGMAVAVSRQDANGEPAGGWQPQQTITREQALAAYTAGAAYAGFAEGRFGELKPGERADFLLVDRDPLAATAADLRQTRVLETWIGGQKVYAADK
uniref:amidohydrolase n=1 Tax=Altererythrobacter segetis TaxID=1104773 RepID=UPI00140D5684|nr:amidohydrolase [Altererythrobacter segetis]